MSGNCPAETDRSGCLELIQQASTMTLGTAGAEGPWTAPVYYLYEKQGFYFFSHPESRHVQEGENLRCAAAIFSDDPDVEKIRGIQMAGMFSRCRISRETAGIALAYSQRFHIRVGVGNVLDYFREVFHAALYRFTPDTVFYMDNCSKFGNRRQIIL